MRATVYWSRILLLIIFGRKVNIHLTKSVMVLMMYFILKNYSNKIN